MLVEHDETYRFKGAEYVATVEDSELSGDVTVSFQRLPVGQVDDEPAVFLTTAGELLDTDGAYLGHVSELQRVKEQAR